MNYQELFQRASIMQCAEVEIENLGKIRIKKRTAADHLAKEKLFLAHGTQENGQLHIEPLRLAMLEVRLGVVDENGKAFLREEDVLNLPKDTVYAIYNAITDFNDATPDLDDLAKKS